MLVLLLEEIFIINNKENIKERIKKGIKERP